MRLWTVHPQYLDTKGLLAAWREGLLAQKVLLGQTRGYTHHPQLDRFRSSPAQSIANYLIGLLNEADRRGYNFNRAKISLRRSEGKVVATRGQLLFEWSHLKRKLRRRSPEFYRACCKIDMPRAHPLFRIVPGQVQSWERTNSNRPISGKVRRARK